MAALVWDQVGTRKFEAGTSHGALFVQDKTGKYGPGVAWSGLTKVTEKPDGAEATALYADDIKYLSLMSEEVMKGSIEAYTYPDEFAVCDGSATPADGVAIGQQPRVAFGLAYWTKVGNDTQGQEFGHKLHLLYNAKVSPSERGYETVNDKPDGLKLNWDFTTTSVEVTADIKPTALITIDSTVADEGKLKALEDKLFGVGDTTTPTLPSPAEVVGMFTPSAPSPSGK